MKKKIIYLVIMIITLLLSMKNINAVIYTDIIVEREWIHNEYVSKKKGNKIFFQQFTELKELVIDNMYIILSHELQQLVEQFIQVIMETI